MFGRRSKWIFAMSYVSCTFVACTLDVRTSDLNTDVSYVLSQIKKVDPPEKVTLANGEDPVTLKVQIFNIRSKPLESFSPQLEILGGEGADYKCTSTDGSGVSLCKLTSTTWGKRVVRLKNAEVREYAEVVFYDTHSNLELITTSAVAANGQATGGVKVQIVNEKNQPVVGSVPNLKLSGLSATNVRCSATDNSGQAMCFVSSTEAGTLTIGAVYPLLEKTVKVVFEKPALASVDDRGPTVPAGTTVGASDPSSRTEVTVTLTDDQGNPKVGETPILNFYPPGNIDYVCTPTNAQGVSTCQIVSSEEGPRVISVVDPSTGSTLPETIGVHYGNPNSVTTVLHPEIPVAADNSSEHMISVTLKDNQNQPMSGVLPEGSVVGAGNNTLRCEASDANGVATCYVKSDTEGTKVISFDNPVVPESVTVVFAPSNVVLLTDTPLADGKTPAAIEVETKDENGKTLPYETPVLDVGDDGSGGTHYVCTAANEEGKALCYIYTNEEGAHTVKVTSPAGSQQTVDVFFSDPNSSIEVTKGLAVADGVDIASVKINVRNEEGLPKVGVTPDISVIGNGSITKSCGMTGILGNASCDITSTTWGVKTVKVTSPSLTQVVYVTFKDAFTTLSEETPGSLVAYSAVMNYAAKVKVTLKDYQGNPIVGFTPKVDLTMASSLSSACSSSDASGISVCQVYSSAVGTFAFKLLEPLSDASVDVQFLSKTRLCSVDFGQGDQNWTGPNFSDYENCTRLTCEPGFTALANSCTEYDAPLGAAFTINNGQTETGSATVALDITCPTDLSVTVEMLASEDANANTGWVPCAATASLNLSASTGNKTVYMKFRDRYGNTSTPISQNIFVDLTPPMGASLSVLGMNGNGAVGSQNIGLSITCPTDDNGPIQMALDNATSPNAGWIDCVGLTSFTLPAGTGTKNIYARFKDTFGNTTTDVVTSVILDQTGPTSTVTYNDVYQSTTNMTVSSTAVDDYSTPNSCELEMDFAAMSNGLAGLFMGYSPVADNSCNASHTITGQSGYAYRFRARSTDAFGNVGAYGTSANVIKIDTTAPVGGAISSPGYTVTSPIAISVNFGSDAESGLSVAGSDYKIEVATASYSGSCGGFGAYSNTGLGLSVGTTTYNYAVSSGLCYNFRLTTKNRAGLASTFTAASPTAVDYTYWWEVGGWGGCDAAQPGWQVGGWSGCSAPQPSWQVGTWGVCYLNASYVCVADRSVSCPTNGGSQSRSVWCPTNYGNQYRSVWCRRSDGAVVANGYCNAGTMPASATSCSRNDCAGGAPASSTGCSRNDCPGGAPASQDTNCFCGGDGSGDGGDGGGE